MFVLLNGFAVIVVFGSLELFLFRFPFCELSLTFPTLVVCHDIGKETVNDAFDGILQNIGVDELLRIPKRSLLSMLVVEFESVLGVFGVCVRRHFFRFVV